MRPPVFTITRGSGATSANALIVGSLDHAAWSMLRVWYDAGLTLPGYLGKSLAVDHRAGRRAGAHLSHRLEQPGGQVDVPHATIHGIVGERPHRQDTPLRHSRQAKR